ncbi:peptide chain release factor PrfB3, chloroplastic-like [Olea europaea var. sylvestris]|uniref:peptide chain release factor PrfB3, chloroplastic-like n=1 Tax=Olea europaea var. sylvestris TaxID=158386 RepID=UPI000C1D580E|nr:peptide chain release factor PrfB3, chloroplastic-like [Olea europaea var. sylvestris]
MTKTWLGHLEEMWPQPLQLMHSKKRIADSILHAEILAPIALEHDEAEEAKSIKELAELDTVNYELFKHAYFVSVDLNKFLDKYETSKFLKKSYDMEGACPKIESRCGDISLETWTGQLARMYMKWAEKQGHAVRLVERCPAKNGGIKSATIEFEFKYAYGYLLGERGVHRIIGNPKSGFNYPEFPQVVARHILVSELNSVPKVLEQEEATIWWQKNQKNLCVFGKLSSKFTAVDVTPLFLESSLGLLIDDKDLLVSCPSSSKKLGKISSSVSIQHILTGVEVQSTVI